MIRLLVLLSLLMPSLRETFTNVGRGRPVRQGQAFKKVKRLSPRGGVHGFAEVGEGDGNVDEEQALREAFPKRWKWFAFAVWTNTPIVLRMLRFKVIETGGANKYVVPGRKGVGPHRYLLYVIYQDRITREVRARVNTHFHAAAWNNRPNKHDEWRKEMWLKQMRALEELVERLVDKRGIPTTVSGDFNPGERDTKPHPRAVLAHQHATDRMWAVPPKGHRVVIKRRFKHDVGIDFHKIIGADILYKKEK